MRLRKLHEFVQKTFFPCSTVLGNEPTLPVYRPRAWDMFAIHELRAEHNLS